MSYARPPEHGIARRLPLNRADETRLWLALVSLVLGCAIPGRVDTIQNRLGDLLLVGFQGPVVEGNEEVRRLVCDTKVAGLILFDRDVPTGRLRNIRSPEQVRRLTNDLRALARACRRRPLLITADNEGGAVMRLNSSAGYPPTFGHAELGARNDILLTELEARRIAQMLRAAGIDWNLAPVVDLALNPLNPVVVRRGRTFAAEPERVVAHARAYLQGMHAEGILTTLKHFPGHGSSQADSHLEFVDVSETANLALELAPYRELIAYGVVDSVMTAHVFNRHLDREYPATLSARTITGILREDLAFTGVVVSDDLMMEGIVSRYGLEAAALLALGAGADLLILSNNTPGRDGTETDRVLNAISAGLANGRLSHERVATSLARVERFRARLPAESYGHR